MQRPVALWVRIFAGLSLAAPVIIFFIVAFQTPEFHLLPLRFNPFLLIPIVSLAVDLTLLAIMLRKPLRGEESLWLLVMIMLFSVVAASEILQHLSVATRASLFWVDIASVAGMLGPVTALFALAYTNRSERRFYGWQAGAVVAALLYTCLDLVVLYAQPQYLRYAHSPWGWDAGLDSSSVPSLNLLVAAAYVWYLGLSIAAIWMLVQFRRRSRNIILRRQALLFLFAVVMPVVAAVVFGSIPNLPSLNSPISAISAAILVYGIYRYHVLTVSPSQFSETILSLMQEAVVVIDRRYTILYVNPVAEALLGHPDTTHAQVTLVQFLMPDSAARLRKTRDSEATEDTFHIDRLDVYRQHAMAVPVKAAGAHLRITGLEAWVVVLTDITSEVETRKVVEHEVRVRTHELHEARAYLVASIDSLEQGFLLLNGKAQLELLNDRARKLFHIGTGELRPQPIGAILSSETWQQDLGKAISRATEQRRSHHLSAAASDGSFYEVYVTPVLAGSHLLGVTVVIEDVTEAKILERSKDEFFSIASHELRTPLTAIRGNMSMVKDYFTDAMKDETLSSLVADTHAASVRLIEIVNDFLDSSRLEQGKMAFTFAPVEVAPLVTAVQGDLQVLAAQQQNTMKSVGLTGLPAVQADEGRLRQILYNLISNANKYSTGAAITVSGAVEDKKLRIRITDMGKGISPENQKLLFHKFQQAGGNILTRDNTKGTGLGLYISRLLATSMHGTVELEYSQEGNGSTFAVTMPLSTAKDREAAATMRNKLKG